MVIEAKIIEDSVSEAGARLTTMQLRYPRFIHAEFMTHRAFSRNASSSRAIPVDRMIEQVMTDPAMPIHWGKNRPGMQATEQIAGEDVYYAMGIWREAAISAAELAKLMSAAGVHKQVVNRLLEPYMYISVVVTATDWDNFFELRLHPDAQPEMQELAGVMRVVMDRSVPAAKRIGVWHLPYVSTDERGSMGTTTAAKVSAARCARVSYLNHDGSTPDVASDLALFERLAGSMPKHSSPTEHQAFPLQDRYSRINNFIGWVQFRRLIDTGKVI